MAPDRAETVRGIYARMAEGDFHVTEDLLDEHVVMVIPPLFGADFPDVGVYVGPQAIAEYTRGFLEPMDDFAMQAEEMLPAGDSVVVAVRQHGVGKVSGIPTEMQYFTVWSFRGPKVIRIESFRDRETACEAAGLPAADQPT